MINDTPQDTARLQHVARLMSDASPEFRDAIAQTALVLSSPMSNKNRERLIDRLANRLREGLYEAAGELCIAPAAVEEIIGAIIIGSAELAMTFPTEWGRA